MKIISPRRVLLVGPGDTLQREQTKKTPQVWQLLLREGIIVWTKVDQAKIH